MVQRSIGQERFGFSGSERTTSSLDALVSLIDWHAVAVLLDPLYPASKGEPAWPPLAMFKALLLSIWYDLSDVKLAESPSRPPISMTARQVPVPCPLPTRRHTITLWHWGRVRA